MPAPGEEWEKFHGDFDNPVYIAWEKFRRDSTLDFQESVNRHFEDLGFKLLRPNYVSSVLKLNWTGYPFENALHLWDWVFQENCHAFVIKHSWPQFLTESGHRYNMGRIKGIPSMSLFYPDRYDSFYFSWALCMAWGQLFTATPEGADMCATEKIFRDFEKKHSEILFNQQKKADITIYWSSQSATYCNPDVCNHASAVKSWLQALSFAGYSTDMVFASEEKIDKSIHKCLLVPDVMMMSDYEYEKISSFADNGGTVIYTGRPGAKKPDGTYRTPEQMHVNMKIPDEPLMTPDPIAFSLGKGRIIVFGPTPLDNDYYEPHSVNRLMDRDEKKKLPEYKAGAMAAKAEDLIGEYISKMIGVIPANPLVNTYYAYDHKHENLIVHIINAMGTLDSKSIEEGHNELIPGFIKDAQSIEVVLSVNIPGIKKAYLHSIEIDGEVILDAKQNDGKTLIKIPKGFFSGYGLLRIPLVKDEGN
jgi:hypothetical protein